MPRLGLNGDCRCSGANAAGKLARVGATCGFGASGVSSRVPTCRRLAAKVRLPRSLFTSRCEICLLDNQDFAGEPENAALAKDKNEQGGWARREQIAVLLSALERQIEGS